MRVKLVRELYHVDDGRMCDVLYMYRSQRYDGALFVRDRFRRYSRDGLIKLLAYYLFMDHCKKHDDGVPISKLILAAGLLGIGGCEGG